MGSEDNMPAYIKLFYSLKNRRCTECRELIEDPSSGWYLVPGEDRIMHDGPCRHRYLLRKGIVGE